MPTDAALRAAIFAAPDDDAPRLVYADWLLEQGDPRGELIQLQCAPAATPAIEARIRKLLALHGKAWLAPIRAAIRTWTWRRGFVDGVQADATKLLAALDRIVAATPLEHVELTALKPKQLERFGAHRAMRGVRSVKLWQQRVTGAQVAAFAAPGFAQVRTLDLFGNPLGEAGVAALATAKLPALRELNLEYTGLTDAAVATLVAAPWFARLTVLSVRSNDDLTPAACGAIAKRGAALVDLDVSGAGGDAAAEAFAASKAMRALRRLDLWDLGEAGARAILDSPNLRKLEKLCYDPSRLKARTPTGKAIRARFGDGDYEHRFGA